MTDAELGRKLGSGRVAELFEWNGNAAKRFRSAAGKAPAFREAANQAVAEALGLPVPAVLEVRQIGGNWAIVMERIDEPSLADLARRRPEAIPEYLELMTGLHRRIHDCRPVGLAGFKTRLAASIHSAGLETGLAEALLLRLHEMPEGDHLCHGDFHAENILGEATKARIVDWANATSGEPAADVCRSYLIMHLYAEALALPYVDAYCRSGGVPPETVMRWLPFIAAARLDEGVADEKDRLMAMVGQP